MREVRSFLPAAVLLLLSVPLAPAQTAEFRLVGVGEPAPDFALTGATRWGVLRDEVRLSDFRGKTVVLAFFFRARTPG